MPLSDAQKRQKHARISEINRLNIADGITRNSIQTQLGRETEKKDQQVLQGQLDAVVRRIDTRNAEWSKLTNELRDG
jgi:hypothetical protein